MAKPRTESPIPSNGLTRECSHCGTERPLEDIGYPSTFPCPKCGAMSAWLCHVCGVRVQGGTTKLEDGRSACGGCRFEIIKGLSARSVAALVAATEREMRA